MNTQKKKTFYEIDRQKAKMQASAETIAYIEALETIANVACNLWIQLGQPLQKECADDVFDALEVVDFMHEESEA